MMKKIVILSMACLFFACESNSTENLTFRAEVVNGPFKFNEGNTWDGSTLYVSNFGNDGDAPNPINTEGKGYISKVVNGTATSFIAANGSLSAPKGMAVVNGYLLIADLQKLLIYSLTNTATPYKTLNFTGDNNNFVNDIVGKDKMAYISVTSTGKIFTLDMTDPASLTDVSLKEYATVVGANGLVLNGDNLYVASYPADGNTVVDNVIYVVNTKIAKPTATKLITRQGQYDGLAIKGNKLFFTNWENKGEVGYVNLDDNKVTIMTIEGHAFGGPADMSYYNGKLYICDLGKSNLISIDISGIK